MSPLEIVLWIVNFATLAVFGVVISGVLRRQHLLDQGVVDMSGARRLGPRTGRRIAALEQMVLDRTEPHEFVFLSVTCPSCLEIAERIGLRAQSEPEYAEGLTVLFEGSETLQFPAHVRVLSDQSEAFEAAGISVVPYAVAVSDGIVVASAPVSASEEAPSGRISGNGSVPIGLTRSAVEPRAGS